MLSAVADLPRSRQRGHAPLPDPAVPLRVAAEIGERHRGPRTLLGLRPWLDGDEPPAGNEIPASALADGSRVDELLADAAAQWGGSAHASAALAWKTYCYWAIVPAVLGYVAARRIPLLEADNFAFTVAGAEPRFSGRQLAPRFLVRADDPIASAPGVEIAADESAMLDRLRQNLFEDHLDPVLEAVRGRVRIGRRTLLGSLASGLCYAVANCAPAGSEPPEVLAKNLLATFEVADLVDVSTDEHGRLDYRRHTCCLAFTIEGRGTCATCCVRGEHR